MTKLEEVEIQDSSIVLETSRSRSGGYEDNGILCLFVCLFVKNMIY